MNSYLDRYLMGEYKQVWGELGSMGSYVYDETLHEDAWAVACETMRRVRININHLIPRLAKIGYKFGYGWIQPSSTEQFDWQKRQAYDDMRQWAAKQPTIIQLTSDREEHLAYEEQKLKRLQEIKAPKIIINSCQNLIRNLQVQPSPITALDVIENEVGKVPLSIRAWYEIIGSVNFVGYHEEWLKLLTSKSNYSSWYEHQNDPHPFYKLDPLFIYPLDFEPLTHFQSWQENRGKKNSFSFPLISNGYGAYGTWSQDALDYEIILPSPTMDTVLTKASLNVTFVEYLRNSFQWGGFPGWGTLQNHPEQDIRFLREGLLPI